MDDTPQAMPNRLEKDRIFSSARTLCLHWADNTLPPTLENLDDKLFHMADKAGNNAEQSRYFQSRDEINRNKTVIQQRFHNHINLAFDHYHQGMNTSTDFNSDPMQKGDDNVEVLEENLSLVDKTELEEKLALAAMTRKRIADNAEALYALNQRLSALRGGSKITDYSNPFAPGVFAEGLQAAITELTLDEASRLLIYKIFDNTFMAGLHPLYQEINLQLQNSGVLPNLNYQIRKTPEEILADLPEELKNQLSQVSMQKQLDLIHAIQLLQSRLRPQPAIQRPYSVSALPAAQVLASIQQLQHNASVLLSGLDTQQAVAASNTEQLRQQVEAQIRRSDDIDENVIEIVGLLFEYMLNDQQLPDSVKTLLSYLHTPFLKIALIDKDFFNRPEHPARQLLNSLVAAGERWVEPSGKRKSEVFEQIRKIVHRVLKEFDNDIRLFSVLAFEFNQYLRQHSRRIRMTEQRAMQAAQGENKLKEIRLKVETYLKARVGSIHLSPAVETLLFEPWANFLAFNLLRFGSRSLQWRQAAQVVDDILWYCLPHDTQADFHAQKRIEELQQMLPEALKTGFDTVGYDTRQGQRLIDMLAQRQSNTLVDKPAPSVPAAAPVDIDTVKIDQQVAAAIHADPLLAKLKNVAVDTWFEFNASSNEPQQVKLAWANTKTFHFMFVNKIGQQVAIKSGQQLAAELRSGQTRKLAALGDKPFFEKAMERVLEQLKQRQTTNAG